MTFAGLQNFKQFLNFGVVEFENCIFSEQRELIREL